MRRFCVTRADAQAAGVVRGLAVAFDLRDADLQLERHAGDLLASRGLFCSRSFDRLAERKLERRRCARCCPR